MSERPALCGTERLVLAALSRRPLGLYPAASVAVATGADHNKVAQALARLEKLGLVTGEPETVPSRPVRREIVWRIDVQAAWSRVPDVLRHTPLPSVTPAPLPECVPQRFGHLFWWGDPSLYRLPRDAALVAEQVLTSDDVTAWGWALFTLPCEALQRVAQKPHVPADRRELIHETLAKRLAATV